MDHKETLVSLTDFSSVGRAFDCRSIVVIKLSLVRFRQVGIGEPTVHLLPLKGEPMFQDATQWHRVVEHLRCYPLNLSL